MDGWMDGKFYLSTVVLSNKTNYKQFLLYELIMQGRKGQCDENFPVTNI